MFKTLPILILSGCVLILSSSIPIFAQTTPAEAATSPSPIAEVVVAPVEAQVLRARGGLKNTFDKLQQGDPVTIAYFGGSITNGAGASGEKYTYRALVTSWLRARYPKSQITEVNASIGGTGSDLGVFRFGQDVLKHQPDLIFVEFAVNDGSTPTPQILRAMEGIFRQAWRANPLTDLCLVYTYQQGQQKDLEQGVFPRAASVQDFLAEKYAIPAISVAMPVADLVREGKMLPRPPRDAQEQALPIPEGVSVFSADGVHPKDEAMALYARTISDALVEMETVGQSGAHALPPAVLADNQENATLVPLQPAMLSQGWQVLDSEKGIGQQFHRFLPQIWQGSAGDTLTFQFRGTTAKIFDIVGPDAGQIWISVDGVKRSQPVPRFDSFSSYLRLQSLTLAENLPDALHTVRIEVDANQPDRTPAMKGEKDSQKIDPKKYDGTFIRIGWLMIEGQIVPFQTPTAVEPADVPAPK